MPIQSSLILPFPFRSDKHTSAMASGKTPPGTLNDSIEGCRCVLPCKPCYAARVSKGGMEALATTHTFQISFYILEPTILVCGQGNRVSGPALVDVLL